MDDLRKNRTTRGRWKNYPFYYTILSLGEMKTEATQEDLVNAAERVNRSMLKRCQGDDRASRFRRLDAEAALRFSKLFSISTHLDRAVYGIAGPQVVQKLLSRTKINGYPTARRLLGSVLCTEGVLVLESTGEYSSLGFCTEGVSSLRECLEKPIWRRVVG